MTGFKFIRAEGFTGTLTCCSLPRVSVKRRSTNLTSLSLIVWNISFGVLISFPLLTNPFGVFIESNILPEIKVAPK